MIRGLLLGFLLLLANCGKDSAGAGKSGGKSTDAKEQAGSQNNAVKITPDTQKTVGLHVLSVVARAVPVVFTAPGQIALNEDHTVHVGTYADGRVVEVNATVGEHVAKGMVLARLHSHSVHETRAALDSAGQEVGRQEEVVSYRKRMRDRMERLLALKSASPQELERTQSELASAQTDLENARINQQKETAHLADILRLPESDLANITEETERAPILAPISGVVMSRNVTLGTIVEPGTETFVITDLRSVWMLAAVNEPDIAKLRVGGTAKILTDAYPNEDFIGRISYVASQVDAQTRTLQGRILLQNPAGKLRPGMFGNAQIREGSSGRSIFLPERAIQDLNGGSVVFVRKTSNRAL